MDSKYGKVFVTAFAIIMMANTERSWAESSGGYNPDGGAASASARVRISVTVPVRVKVGLSAEGGNTWSNTANTDSGLYISCAGVATEIPECLDSQEIGATYTATVL